MSAPHIMNHYDDIEQLRLLMVQLGTVADTLAKTLAQIDSLALKL